MNQNSFGLTDSDLITIIQTLMQFEEIDEAYIYGSRAKGNFRNGSDVDIALKGADIKRSQVLEISAILNEETNMPYRFEIVHFDNIDTKALTEHVNRVGKVIYTRVNEVVLQESKTKYQSKMD